MLCSITPLHLFFASYGDLKIDAFHGLNRSPSGVKGLTYCRNKYNIAGRLNQLFTLVH